MRNPKLDAAKKILQRNGVDLPDREMTALLAEIDKATAVEYETGDFVEFNEGMGEMGHGWIRGLEGKDYKVLVWSPDEEKYPQYNRVIARGDVFRLSSEARAQQYHNERSRA